MDSIDSKLLMLLVSYDEVFARYTAGKLTAEAAADKVAANTVTDEHGTVWGLTAGRTWYKSVPGQPTVRDADPREFASTPAFTTVITAPDTNTDTHRSVQRPTVTWHEPPTDTGGTFYRWTPPDQPKWPAVQLTTIANQIWPWLVIAIGVVLLIGAVPRIQQGLNPAKYRTATASAAVDVNDIKTIVGPVIGPDGRVRQGKTTSCDTTFSYTINNTTHTLTVASTPDPNTPRKTPVLCKLHKGDQVDVKYNPKRPGGAQPAIGPATAGIDIRTLIEGALISLVGLVAGVAGVWVLRRRR